MPSQNFLNPKFGITFDDLYAREGLEKLDKKFDEFVGDRKPGLLGLAHILEDFLTELFSIKKENDELKKRHEDLKKIYQARLEFVQRDVSKKIKEAPVGLDGIRILQDLEIPFDDVDELEKKLAEEILQQKNLEKLTQYTAWALYSDAGKKLHKNGGLFILPKKVDPQNLISPCEKKPLRQDFNLTDEGFGLNRVQAEANYCIFCHRQEKDSCRTGIRDKETKEIKIDSLGVELHGCPLDEKISEMNMLKAEGFSLAAFATAIIDNPMIAGTGHRICNDCMKSCIYQKQDPVEIPQIETRILKDVLNLPYGFEIYSLLTRWNPLNFARKIPHAPTGKKILICGLGPAGYTLAHHLLNDGHEVVAIDGLKIEPLNPEISGIDELGNRVEFRPIKFLDEIYEPLSTRLIQGFGGVAEYGITVRWDKNYLKIIRLLLERRKNFRMFGGIRFGSSITEKTAFEDYGFDHVALCIGAGRPNIINIKNNFAKGVRSASDFLMSLQLTGSFKEELFTNLQIRMPVLVVGGGLTATDTACEAKAYYSVQIKKFAKKVAAIGKEKIFKILNEEEKIIAEEFLRDEKKLREGDESFSDVKIIYRKRLQDAPAYRLNHPELGKAFEEAIEFVENITPLEAELDEFGHIKNLKCADGKTFPCKSLLVAAGTTPNLSPKLEDGLDFEIDGKYFAEISENHKHYAITHSARPREFSVITKIEDETKKAVSFFGDLHPNFEGNVVKAMASAKLGHEQITQILNHQPQNLPKAKRDFAKDFLVRIEKIERLSDHVVEVSVRAPLLANQTKVGHIFRLQNYHALLREKNNQLEAMEGVALTALSIDRQKGIITCIALEVGGSTNLIKNFKAGEPCIFMGPTGAPTEIPQNEIVLLVGGGRGNQPLTAIAEEFQKNGCKVFFFAGYRKNSFVVREEQMKKFSDELIISISDEAAENGRFHGSVIEALKNYFTKNPQKIDRIFTIGNDNMMHEVAKLRHENLVESLAQAKVAITSLNAPMQCMMKGVCSQCLQKRVSEKGEAEYFYSCGQQDQNMDRLDFKHLHYRCEQNSLAEKTAKMWIEFLGAN